MKVVILHGTGSTSNNNWFPWLKTELEKLGHQVWVPDLPGAEHPNIERYNKYLMDSGWDFNNNLMIGHSSGAVAALGLLQSFPESVKIDTAILIGVFRGHLNRDDLVGVDIPYDYEKIRTRAKRFLVIQSDDDPYCPEEGARWISEQLKAEFKLMSKMGHFSSHLDPKFKRFPELLDIIRNLPN